MANFKEYKTREEWLNARFATIGASEVASVLGFSEKKAIDLWQEKTKRKEPKELSGDKRVAYGTAAESSLRALFALQFAEKYEMEYYPFRIYKHDKHECLSATLDGELIRKEDKARGVWECKTAWICSRADLARWDNNSIPQIYYAQVCAQLAVTAYSFAVLSAQLIFMDGHSEIRHYFMERAEMLDDINFVESEVAAFYEQYIVADEMPPERLTL